MHESEEIFAHRLPDYVEYVRDKAFTKFECPSCQKGI